MLGFLWVLMLLAVPNSLAQTARAAAKVDKRTRFDEPCLDRLSILLKKRMTGEKIRFILGDSRSARVLP